VGHHYGSNLLAIFVQFSQNQSVPFALRAELVDLLTLHVSPGRELVDLSRLAEDFVDENSEIEGEAELKGMVNRK
jgi:hypothetical protein